MKVALLGVLLPRITWYKRMNRTTTVEWVRRAVFQAGFINSVRFVYNDLSTCLLCEISHNQTVAIILMLIDS